MRGGEQDRHRTTLGIADQGGPLRAGGVHHRQYVVHSGLQVGHTRGPVGHPGTALVEADQPAHAAQPVEEVGVPRIQPVVVQVGDEARHQYQVAIAASGQLVGDAQPVARGVVHRQGTPDRRRLAARRGGDVVGLLDRLGHEPVAAAVQCLDHPLGLSVVPERATSLLDPTGHRGLADEPAAPQGVHQLFLGDDAVAVPHEVGEHVEDLRLHGHRHAVPPQLEGGEIQLHPLEEEPHATEPSTPAVRRNSVRPSPADESLHAFSTCSPRAAGPFGRGLSHDDQRPCHPHPARRRPAEARRVPRPPERPPSATPSRCCQASCPSG